MRLAGLRSEEFPQIIPIRSLWSLYQIFQKLADLKQEKLIPSLSWRLRIQHEDVGRATVSLESPPTPGGYWCSLALVKSLTSPPLSFQGLWKHLFCCHSQIFLCSFLLGRIIFGLWGYLDDTGSSHLKILKTLILNKISFSVFELKHGWETDIYFGGNVPATIIPSILKFVWLELIDHVFSWFQFV